jgi:hypothetical protein
MAMVGGIFSGLFDPTTCSRSSPMTADQQSTADIQALQMFLYL